MEHVSANLSVRKIDRFIAYIVSHVWIKTIVFLVAFLEAIIIPILPEIIVAGVLAYRKDISWKLLSLISTLGSTIGAGVMYFLGKYLYFLNEAFFLKFLDGGRIAEYTEKILGENTFIIMFLAALTPLPDKVFAFLGGVFSLSFFVLLLAFFIGRFIRVGIIAYLSYHFGDEARIYIVKHTKQVTLIIIGIIVLYILYKTVM